MSDLPDPGDPLVTTSGKIIKPIDLGGEDVLEPSELRRTVLPFKHYRPAKDLNVNKIPEADPEEQSLVALVVAYRLMGMSDSDMADYLNVSIADIETITAKSSVQKTFEMIVQGVIDANSVLIQGRIANHADSASKVVVELMEGKEIRPDVRLKAAQDVLDRAGTNADQFFKEADDRSGQSDSIIIETYVGDEEAAPSTKVTVKR